ncbi:ComEC/Rec2 family competence protein [Campylobacter lari]|uniref:ComEC/Rec2 family competence protein n=1 Tax=Campylobacter lari TaxID=201 RepID=A0A5L4NP17_CAMLA|nr:ComEC/Rec2 family competence protein [Campylobacter sp. IFREMER_LSEM_CL1097]EAI3905258.1 ComEC/Rec2 family competence protein [Campylobacter lari]EAI3913655.1 ComEC/Rec2 family competence protein [Campylobacter lari]EAI4449125.1 ComEC/Rec2 family competence protein [Campylobacter lari]EAK0828469.1 ComEC/Rec2 family competence protein [Campylobacter lari]MCV3443140.1 ComEC/Rec2 family competence protein [Campylobacter sp. IFREMER_LSEM_CL1097]
MNLKFSIKDSYREFLILLLCFLAIFSLNLIYEYKKYQNFKLTKHLLLKNNIIISSYQKTNKKGKKYQVFKIKNSDFVFYTTSFKDLNLSKNDIINLRIITKNINFKDYLSKNFFVPSYDFHKTNTQKENILVEYFLNQHQNEKIKEFYGALFFAKNVSSELRNDVNFYNIAHLIAISGYHLGLLFSFCFLIFAPLYTFFHKRYFPYRSLKLDISIFAFLLLILYIFLIDFSPSYIRALCMSIFAFYLFSKNIKILSFKFLFLSVILCISLFPNLLFSVGFLFSSLGVFYIYLYLHHFKDNFSKNYIHIIFINFWTFLAMMIPVLYFFPLISFQQFLGIPLSILFALFYPISLLLHLLSYGDVLDEILLALFDFKLNSILLHIPLEIYLIYIFLSFMAIFHRYLALFVISLGFIPFIFLI